MVSGERRYEVLSILGKGGFGTVYHARLLGEGGFTKDVALKVLNPDMENVAEIASRLRDEARVLGLIRHRAIVGVDLLTQLDGRWTIVMEYIEGTDCTRLLGAGKVPVGAALEITAEIAGALHAAYSRLGPSGQPLRLLHRDIKPSNIRITPFGEVKVLDFGIARAEFGGRESKTRSLAFGTPEYMSPERLDFSGDSAAGDVYALGAVLFELLTSVQLGRTSANPAKHTRKLDMAMATLREAHTPEPVCELLNRMLSFEEQARPTATEVERRANALARSMGGVPLREWVDDLAEALADSAQFDDPATGSILIERAETSPEDAGGTIWQRAPSPSAGGPRVSHPPLQLTPAATSMVPGESPKSATPVRPAGEDLRTPPRERDFTTSGFALKLIAGGVALLFLAVAVGIGLKLSRSTAPETAVAGKLAEPAVTMPATTPLKGDVPGPVTPLEVPVDAPRTEHDATKPNSTADSKPNSTAVVRQEKPTPKASSAPATVAVGLTGDASGVFLYSGTTSYALPGPVPPGNYKILASFPGEPTGSVGTVLVVANKAITIHCDSDYGLCVDSRASK